MIAVGGDSLRHLGPRDLAGLARLNGRAPREIFEIPSTAAALLALLDDLARKPWSMPMLCLRNGEPAGLCTISAGQVKNLNAYLVAVFAKPEGADRLLALYMRQAFWTYPLHRLYAQLPDMAVARPHIELLVRTGFTREGTLVQHIDSKPRTDAVVLGILREEFDSWCADHEPQLALP